MKKAIICYIFMVAGLTSALLLAFSPAPRIYFEDSCPIHSTRTATVGYVSRTVVDIQVTMTYPGENESLPSREVSWIGSGILLDRGLVLTNWHVADDQIQPIKRYYKITYFDGRHSEAVFIRADMSVDLGLLQLLNPPEGLWEAVLADYDPVQGQDTLVFGSPRGLRGSVSHGILSATGREIRVRLYRTGPVSSILYKNMLQTDAPINPGNSGGPLTDIWGRVIGLVNAGGSGDGMGFAVPIEAIRKFLNRG